MTNEKALEFLKSARETRKDCAIAVEVYDIVIEAVEKQIPKRIWISDGSANCPECGNNVKSYEDFCDLCGQKLDWGEVRAND